jgi:hypothetical protein
MSITHDFHESLALSEVIADEPWWEDVYRQAFPFFKSMERVPGDTPEQLAGIDRIVHLQEGGMIYIDEKVRHADYDDILLEIHSSQERQTWGWACKPLVCDYIAYAFLPSKRCYLFPFQQLQQALRNHWEDWQARYQPVKAVNRGYTTLSIAVPISTLQQAITEAGLIQWDRLLTT